MSLNRILIAGTGSGCGKTTVTCSILKALINLGLKVQPYKCGPDYIDPMFHTYITKRISRNLDTYMMDSETIKWLLAKNSYKADISVIEGVMGYYDGVGANGDFSTYDLARILKCPVILIVNGKGMAASVAALVKGYIQFKPESNIKGIILNGINSGYYKLQKNAIENSTGICVLGYIPDIKNITLDSRHLGLVKVDEIEKLDYKLDLLAKQAMDTIDLDKLILLAENSVNIEINKPNYLKKIYKYGKFKVGLAKDKAFCFYYQDNIDLLKELGGEIVEFSPINDKKLPEGIDCLYIGGGYPEIYAASISDNLSMKASIYNAVNNKIPTIAECGGFMYLCKGINTFDNKFYQMVGVLDGEVNLTNKLVRFGYVKLKSLTENILSSKAGVIKAHEFHYSDSTLNGNSFEISKPSGIKWLGINATDTLYAGYPHIHFYSNIEFIIKFVRKVISNKCTTYK